jgi:uncharacterized protein (DUF58 family)
VSRHLTWRFWLYMVLGAALVITGLSAPEGEATLPFVAATPFLSVILLSLMSGWWRSIDIERVSLSRLRTIEGDELSIYIDLRCPRPIYIIDLELQLPAQLAPISAPRVVQQLEADSRIRFDVRAIQWGVTGPEFLNVVTRDRFGLTETIQQFPLGNRVHVHPSSERIQAMVRAATTRSAIGDHRSRARGPGMELAEVRAYNNSDPVRRIHPMLSLRRGMPMVADRHTEQATDVVLFIDAVQDVGTPLNSTLRSTVAAAIGLQQRHFRAMDRVGILDRSTGVRWLSPALGRRAGHIIVDTLLSAQVMHDRRGDLPSLPTSNLHTRSLIVAISPLYSEVFVSDLAQLRRAGFSVVVLQVDRAFGFEVSLTEQRMARINATWQQRRLAEIGISVLPWNTELPVEPVLRRAMSSAQTLHARRGSLRNAGAPG